MCVLSTLTSLESLVDLESSLAIGELAKSNPGGVGSNVGDVIGWRFLVVHRKRLKIDVRHQCRRSDDIDPRQLFLDIPCNSGGISLRGPHLCFLMSHSLTGDLRSTQPPFTPPS